MMKKSLFLISLIWIILVSASFVWNYANQKSEQEKIALQAARSFFDQIVISRTWNALHGGVYVPVTEQTQPNPYLEDPMREVVVSEDVTLTKVNPAFMTRQIGEIAKERQGPRFHITSLNPIRPDNRPGPKENDALSRFEEGKREVASFFSRDGKEFFFYMAPLMTTKACLKCHEKQGYQEGDIRGGISVTLPFVPKTAWISLVFGHLLIGIMGIVVIILMGMRLDRAYQTIRTQAIIDALTGIPNRRSFTETLLKEFNRSKRDKKPLSLIMCDIDHFKEYNDTYGHGEGDVCLQKIAKTISSSLERPGDFCARYGGEEFMLILPDTPQTGAIHMAERIRQAILKQEIPHAKSNHQGVVTISLGVATASPDTSLTHEALVKRADEALYRAKEMGRNRVEVGETDKGAIFDERKADI